MRWIYQPIYLVLLLIAAPFLLLARGAHYVPTLKGRFLGPSARGNERESLWIHAVSVGEVGIAAVLAHKLDSVKRVTMTTVTPTGQASAKQLLGDRVDIGFLPFDLFFSINRFLRWARPKALVLIEGDYWPFLLSTLRNRQIPTYVVNGRVSDHTFRTLSHLPRFVVRAYFRAITKFGVQSNQDQDRLLRLGVDQQRIQVTGNLKFDIPTPQSQPELESALQRVAGSRSILVAGSCMEGEEEQVLEAVDSMVSSPLLVIAPRHPERVPKVQNLCSKRGRKSILRSRLEVTSYDSADNCDVVILDTIGELAGLYRVAAGAFVGGTLVRTGGHNPLEPAVFGVPVAIGPSMENFRAIADAFDQAEAWRRVKNAQELGAIWQQWLDEPNQAASIGARAKQLVEQGQGAVAHTLQFLQPVLDDPQAIADD